MWWKMENKENQEIVIRHIAEQLDFIKSSEQNEKLIEVLRKTFDLYCFQPLCPICQSATHISGECETVDLREDYD